MYRSYQELIESVRSRELTKEPGFEFHHIVPRALGGSNSKENLVKLSIFEHILAHYFLALETRNPKMFYAFNCMTMYQFKHISELEKVTLEQLSEWSNLKEEARNLVDISNRVKKHIHRGSERKKVSLEEFENIYRSEGWELGRGPQTEEWRRKGAESRRGKHRSEETKKKISDANKGRVQLRNFMKGKHHSPEAKEKMRQAKLGKPNLHLRGRAKTEEHRKKISETLKEKPKRALINDGKVCRYVELSRLPDYIKLGWSRGRIHE